MKITVTTNDGTVVTVINDDEVGNLERFITLTDLMNRIKDAVNEARHLETRGDTASEVNVLRTGDPQDATGDEFDQQ